jgi:hypothetical protein
MFPPKLRVYEVLVGEGGDRGRGRMGRMNMVLMDFLIGSSSTESYELQEEEVWA